VFFLRSTDPNWQRNRRTIQYRANENKKLLGAKKFGRKPSNERLEEEDPNNQNFETKMTID
jgi:hypothetical protein